MAPAPTHGHCSNWKVSGEYKAWQHAKERCTNPSTKCWEYYGGRGIGMCEHWLRSFPAFLADMGLRPEKLTLDRIDNDKGYLCPRCCPPTGNCRWASRKEQGQNRRNKQSSAVRSRKMSEWWAGQSPEYRHQRAKNTGRKLSERWAKLSEEERHKRSIAAKVRAADRGLLQEWSRKRKEWWAKQTPKYRRERAALAAKAQSEKLSPEQRYQRAVKASRAYAANCAEKRNKCQSIVG